MSALEERLQKLADDIEARMRQDEYILEVIRKVFNAHMLSTNAHLGSTTEAVV